MRESRLIALSHDSRVEGLELVARSTPTHPGADVDARDGMASRERASRRALAFACLFVAFLVVVARARAPRVTREEGEDVEARVAVDDARRGRATFDRDARRGATKEGWMNLFLDPGARFEFASDRREHALVTGGAGFIGAHCVKRLLDAGYAVTTIDNMSRGNGGAIRTLREMAPEGSFRAVYGDLGRRDDVVEAFRNTNKRVDVVFHFAAIAYVGESMADPLRYYSNITSNTVMLLSVMHENGVQKMIYSST